MTAESNAAPRAQTAIEKLKKVQDRTGLSASSIYRLVSLGQFPRPTKLSSSASGWFSDQIDQWLEEKRAQPNPAMGLQMGRKPKLEDGV
jgi:prophage regulatory protein